MITIINFSFHMVAIQIASNCRKINIRYIHNTHFLLIVFAKGVKIYIIFSLLVKLLLNVNHF